MHVSHSSVSPSPKENNVENVGESTPFISKGVPKSGATNQNSISQPLEPEDNRELNPKSLHEHPYNETERKFGEGEGTLKWVIDKSASA